jgi:hypothetical protein
VTIALKILSEKLTFLSNNNVAKLTPGIFHTRVLLLPNFQRSFGITATQFFDWGAKVRGLFISAKFFSIIQKKF